MQPNLNEWKYFRLTEGAVLLVGRDIEARKKIESILTQILVWGLALMLVLGIAGGLIAGRRMVYRVDAAGRVDTLPHRIAGIGRPEHGQDEIGPGRHAPVAEGLAKVLVHRV